MGLSGGARGFGTSARYTNRTIRARGRYFYLCNDSLEPRELVLDILGGNGERGTGVEMSIIIGVVDGGSGSRGLGVVDMLLVKGFDTRKRDGSLCRV